MSRLTLGGIALIDAVGKKWEDAVVTQGEPDGLDVRRALKFDTETSKELGPILWVLNDPRIKSLTDDEAGLIVVFVDNYRADTRLPFDLDSAETVVKAEQPVTEEESEEDSKPAAKKTSAKKPTQ